MKCEDWKLHKIHTNIINALTKFLGEQFNYSISITCVRAKVSRKVLWNYISR